LQTSTSSHLGVERVEDRVDLFSTTRTHVRILCRLTDKTRAAKPLKPKWHKLFRPFSTAQVRHEIRPD
jgi:hypothetical protein